MSILTLPASAVGDRDGVSPDIWHHHLMRIDTMELLCGRVQAGYIQCAPPLFDMKPDKPACPRCLRKAKALGIELLT